MHEKLKLLWVDLSVSDEKSGPEPILRDYFDIVNTGRESGIAQQFKNCKPDVVCFDFDYPDRSGLRMVEEIKRLFPSIPMFVATVQHSEDLAVWAFRSGMKDFLVKPLPEDELLRCYGVLKGIADAKRNQPSRGMARTDQILPLPASAVSASQTPKKQLEPAIYYVEQHFRDKIRAEDVAARCRMSSFRFSRTFKEVYGIAFRDYVVRYRLREAFNMLKTGHVSVTEAACATGFNDVAYFSRMFKKHFQQPPSEFAAEKQKEAGKRSVPDSPTLRLKIPVH